MLIIAYEYVTQAKYINKTETKCSEQKCSQNKASKVQCVHQFVHRSLLILQTVYFFFREMKLPNCLLEGVAMKFYFNVTYCATRHFFQFRNAF